MTIHQKCGLRIRTDFLYPPIPDRRFDWSAVDDETYDGAPDSQTRNQIGFGRTEGEAIECLLEMVCYQEAERFGLVETAVAWRESIEPNACRKPWKCISGGICSLELDLVV